jgi:hypothetical protein
MKNEGPIAPGSANLFSANAKTIRAQIAAISFRQLLNTELDELAWAGELDSHNLDYGTWWEAILSQRLVQKSPIRSRSFSHYETNSGIRPCGAFPWKTFAILVSTASASSIMYAGSPPVCTKN